MTIETTETPTPPARAATDVPLRRALLTVWDKTGLVDLARCLASFGTELYSTGKTAALLREAGLEVRDVQELTGRPEAFGGRMKTLSYEIASALLFDRERDAEEARALGVTPIDLLVANLYPFEEHRDRGLPADELVEYIDIGGPTLVRAAAKNSRYVASVVSPVDYPALIDELTEKRGALSAATRRRLMASAFEATARYARAIADHLAGEQGDRDERSERGAPPLTFGAFGAGVALRYGENPHQRARLHPRAGATSPTELLLSGKELSYNNLLDVEAALSALRGHERGHACVVVKHGNPCGFGVATTPAQALELAWAGDPISAFGSVLAFSSPVTRADLAPLALDATDRTARRFVEVVVAPAFDEGALALLASAKNLRVLPLSVDALPADADARLCLGHLLVQDPDDTLFASLRTATRAPFTPDAELAAFGIRAARAVKSNAIAIVRRAPHDGLQMVGMGAGQPNRVASARLAAGRARETLRAAVGDDDRALADAMGQAYAVSDAFLPFADTLEVLAEAGLRVLLQPGGSLRDGEVIARGDALGVHVVMTETRHFRH